MRCVFDTLILWKVYPVYYMVFSLTSALSQSSGDFSPDDWPSWYSGPSRSNPRLYTSQRTNITDRGIYRSHRPHSSTGPGSTSHRHQNHGASSSCGNSGRNDVALHLHLLARKHIMGIMLSKIPRMHTKQGRSAFPSTERYSVCASHGRNRLVWFIHEVLVKRSPSTTSEQGKRDIYLQPKGHVIATIYSCLGIIENLTGSSGDSVSATEGSCVPETEE